MTTRTNVTLIATASLVLLGSACGFDDLPDDQLLTSPHFRYHARADTPVDPAILDRLEHWRTEFDTKLGIDSAVVDYYLFRDPIDAAAHTPCDRPCTLGRSIYSSVPFQEHELVHAFMGDDSVAPVMAEGLAQHVSCVQSNLAAIVPPATWPEALSRQSSAAVYYFGQRLVAWMLAEGGPERFVRFYGSTFLSIDPALFTLQFERAWGRRLSDVATELVADRYAGSSCPCTAPGLPADGTTASFVAYQSYVTFDAPEESRVQLISDAGAITYPMSCANAADRLADEPFSMPATTTTVARVGPGRYGVAPIVTKFPTVNVSRHQQPASDWSCAAALASPVDVGDGDVAFWVTADRADRDTWFAAKVAGPRSLIPLTDEGLAIPYQSCDGSIGLGASSGPVRPSADGIILVRFVANPPTRFGLHSVGVVLRAEP